MDYAPERLHRRAKMVDSFLEIFVMQADFRTVGELRCILSVLFLSGISDLDLCLAHRAFPLNPAFGQYIGIDYSGAHTLTSSPRSLGTAESVDPLLKFTNRDESERVVPSSRKNLANM
jgi:hypothetical protein